MATYTCHSRWCPYYLPGFKDSETGLPAAELCKDVSWTLQYYFNSTADQLLIAYNEWLPAACKLWCGEPSNQLLQLQSAGLSERVAVLIWFMVILMIVCVVVQLVSICLEWGARKVAMIGGPLFLAFMALMVYFSADYDTAFYPIVGAMNVAALSYYFSSFQYSIAVTYELASGTALFFTMFPVWTLLTMDTKRLLGWEYSAINRVLVREMVWLVSAMLILSICWIIHSSLFRTIGYRATWIAAFNKQLSTEGRRKDFMSSLWILSGAQGHPTWRTPTGQSFGLYLTVLSWIVALRIHNYLARKYCKDDLILFQISLWVSPAILTLAVLATQIFMCRNTSCEVQDNCNSFFWTWFTVDFKSLWISLPHMEEAIISYRLGRDSLEVESSEKVKKYKILLCAGSVSEERLAELLWKIEAILLAIAYPGILVCKICQGLGVCILRCVFKRPQSNSGSFKLRERIKAYQIVRERCFEDTIYQSGETSYDLYERSRRKDHGGLQERHIDEDFRNVLRKHRKDIKLPLVLDNIGLSGFSYLLKRLVEVLNEPSEPLEVLELDEPSEPLEVSLELDEPSEPLEVVGNLENESQEDIDPFLLYWTA